VKSRHGGVVNEAVKAEIDEMLAAAGLPSQVERGKAVVTGMTSFARLQIRRRRLENRIAKISNGAES
jgi:hypothetical protein